MVVRSELASTVRPSTPPVRPHASGQGVRVRLRRAALVFTAFLPQPAKRLVYRWCFGFRIGRGARIGIALLDCRRLVMGEGARISHGVVFLQCGAVSIGRHAVIGPLNLFRGGERVELGDYSQVLRLNIVNAIPENDATNHPDASFYLGYGAVVT